MSGMAERVVRATDEHVTDAIGWMAARGMPEPPRDIFSSTGWVVPGVAGWWLYLTDSTLAWAECLTSNPSVPRGIRREALDAVIDRVLREARLADVRLLCFNIDRTDLEELSLRHGAKVLIERAKLLGVNVYGGG